MSVRRRHPVTGLMAAIGIAAGVACEDRVTPPEVPGGPSTVPVVLEWQHPYPQGNDLRHLWGFSNGTFYAVGDGGTVLHYDGLEWTHIDTPAREDLHRLWVSGPDDIYAAGFGGTLIHYDGDRWERIATPTNTDLYAVCANGPDDIFVTGMGGSVWNYNGSGWTEYVVAPGERLRSLWSYSHDEVYVCGSNETFQQFDGSSWSEYPYPYNSPRDVELRDMWGIDPGSIGVLGGNGAAWTDGSEWRVSGDASGRQAYGFWGVSYDTVVVVSALLSTHYHAGEYIWFDTPTPDPVYDIWGTAADDYYAVGRAGHVAHFDGTGWDLISEGSTSDVNDVWITETGGVAVGDDGLILRRSGAEWTEESVDPETELAGVWVSPALAVAVGRHVPRGLDRGQAILMNAGAGWSDVGPVGEAHRLFDVWGSSATDVYAVGWAGEILHYDGGVWTVAHPAGGNAAYLRSVSGTSPANVVAVGRTNDLRGLVRAYDGVSWTETIIDGVEELCGVWVASETRIFAAGSFGDVVYYDGRTWNPMATPTGEKLFAVWGGASNDVYAAGWGGTLLHYDGDGWTRHVSTMSRNFNAVSGQTNGGVWLAGDGGSVLFHPGI